MFLEVSSSLPLLMLFGALLLLSAALFMLFEALLKVFNREVKVIGFMSMSNGVETKVFASVIKVSVVKSKVSS